MLSENINVHEPILSDCRVACMLTKYWCLAQADVLRTGRPRDSAALLELSAECAAACGALAEALQDVETARMRHVQELLARCVQLCGLSAAASRSAGPELSFASMCGQSCEQCRWACERLERRLVRLSAPET